MLFEKGDSGAYLTGSTVAALEAIMLEECLLDGVQLIAVRESLDSGDLGALRDCGKGEAGVDAAAVDEDGARATLSVVTAFLAAGETEILAESVEQGGAGVDRKGLLLAVDIEGEREGLRGGGRGDACFFCCCYPRQT